MRAKSLSFRPIALSSSVASAGSASCGSSWIFSGSGIVLLVLGAALELAQSASFLAPVKEALNLRRIYDLPVFLMLIGAVYSDRKSVV